MRPQCYGQVVIHGGQKHTRSDIWDIVFVWHKHKTDDWKLVNLTNRIQHVQGWTKTCWCILIFEKGWEGGGRREKDLVHVSQWYTGGWAGWSSSSRPLWSLLLWFQLITRYGVEYNIDGIGLDLLNHPTTQNYLWEDVCIYWNIFLLFFACWTYIGKIFGRGCVNIRSII